MIAGDFNLDTFWLDIAELIQISIANFQNMFIIEYKNNDLHSFEKFMSEF
jgi:hypothetical protein